MQKQFATWCGMAILWLAAAARGPAADVPDLTKGGKQDNNSDWTLGPTGARGWVFSRGFSTADARQILVTEVAPGSPAAGVLAVDDVIVGVNGKLFDGDAREALGRAITEAEKTENLGVLKLLRWRSGEQQDMVLRLAVMGSYSETSPYQCAKAKTIVEQGCRAILKRGLGNDIPGQINALALLASGNPDYLAAVKTFARQVGPADLKLELKEGMFAWEWGYANLFLTEYYLATQDAAVLPAIREYSTKIARGQTAVGTWGHGMSLPTDVPLGSLGGYGAINQSGLICWMSMALAQKCGVADPVVQKAVDKSHRFFGFYINKGPIPYGDHPPYFILHDDNGKSGSAALTFDLLGDQTGAQFFARMATAAYGEKENGHTGNYFSFLWGALGANRAGPEAVAAHLREQRWFYDLARRWDGTFFTNSRDNYGWDMTGLFVLTYALPQQKLYITGRGVSRANRLTGMALQEVVENGRSYRYGRDHDCDDAKNSAALLQGLANWSPTVRYRSAMALAKKPEDHVPQLITMLRSRDLNARYGACQALEYLEDRAAPATDELIKQLAHPDLWLKIRAAFALTGIGQPARKAVPELLKLVIATDPKHDPRGTLSRYIAFGLFKADYVDNLPRRNGLLADSLEGVDRPLLYAAIRRVLAIDDGLCRMMLRTTLTRLSTEELETLWPDIVQAVKVQALSGEMFGNEIRKVGLNLLAQHRIQDGIQVAVDYARHQTAWGSEGRMGEILAVLKSYGAAAKPTLPELRELLTYCRNEQFPEDCKRQKIAAVEDAIKCIEAATNQPSLRSIAGAPGGSR